MEAVERLRAAIKQRAVVQAGNWVKIWCLVGIRVVVSLVVVVLAVCCILVRPPSIHLDGRRTTPAFLWDVLIARLLWFQAFHPPKELRTTGLVWSCKLW